MIFSDFQDIIDSGRKYSIVYADPPWRFTGLGLKGIRSGAMRKDNPLLHKTIKLEEKYPTMSIDEICNLPVKEIVNDIAVCFLWSTDAHLKGAISVLDAWGFQYTTVGFVWNKKTSTNKQVCYYGHWTMKGTELCLLGRRGKIAPIKHDVRQLIEAKRKEHSHKPDEVRDRIIRLMGDLPRIELFARQEVPGWDCFGNQVSPHCLRDNLFGE